MLILHEWKYKSILHASPDVVKRGQRLDLPGIGTNTGPTSPEGKAAVEPADCRQDMGGIGLLDALRFELAARLTGGQKGVEEAVAGIGRLRRGRRRLRYGGSRYGRKAIPLGIPILGLRHCVLPFKAVSIRKGSTVVSHAPARRAWARFI
jgi:hypothetical protein